MMGESWEHFFLNVTFQSVYGCGEENITWGNTKDLLSHVVCSV